jgi:tight adherence protein B
MVEAAEKVAEAGGFSGSLDARLERAGLPLKAGEFVAGTAAAALVGGFLGAALLGNWLFGVLLALVAGAAPSVALAMAQNRRTESMHGQLADIFMTLASSLRAGHSFLQSLDMVAKEIAEPAASEFARVVAEIRLGRPIEDALNAMAERIGSEDLTWAVLAVNIQREVGGNLAEILDTLADVVRERNTIRRQVGVLSAEGRLSMWILAILPVLIALYMTWANPTYIKLLVTTQVGIVMLVVAGCLMTLGVFWMRKLVKIRV